MQQQETIHAVMASLDDDFIRSRIYTIRGVQVMLDRDLATLYGVDTRRINEQVKRNAERFPEDFMFRLTKDECLRSQIAILNMERGKHLKYMPHAFTESGVAMLSGVLRVNERSGPTILRNYQNGRYVHPVDHARIRNPLPQGGGFLV